MKKILVVFVMITTTGCVTTPYYGGGYGAGVYGGGYATTYQYQPAVPYGFYQPAYGVYDPFLGFGSSVVQGVGLGLGWHLINDVFGHHHH